MAKPRLKGVVAGLGVMGSSHLRVLSQMPTEVEVVGAIDLSEESRARAQRPHPRACPSNGKRAVMRGTGEGNMTRFPFDSREPSRVGRHAPAAPLHRGAAGRA